MDGNERITFWELLDEKKIEIPVIQRDYAQGRDKDNVNDIRKNFLNSIKDALKNEEPLDLNFVYGSTKGNTFIPIDGQQRLTTLYLIHVYLMLVLGKKFEKGSNKRIKKFTYETRTTSRDFCKGLTNETIVIRDDKKITDVESISEEIKNNNWFSSSWLNDPTIKAMLNMLDSIHEIFKGEDYEDFFEKLTDDDEDSYIIYFYFLDLGEYNLGDSIYIKLNARGKDLTNYENFKAKNDKYVGINRNIANVLRRALLCKGDYTLFHSSNSSFLIDNDRDISWKRLLRIQSNEKNGTYQNRRKMFFSLIKDPLFDQNDIADSLQKICDRDVAGITDWRKYFITVPEIMDSLHKYTDGRASERYVRFEGKYIFLMGSTRLYGWNEEYYSYALYCLLKKLPNASVKYNQAKGWEDVDCHIELTSSTNAGKWKIKYLRAKDKFSVIDASGVQSLYSTVEDAKYALEKLL